MAEAAAKLHIPDFVPKHGIQIETDPKATAAVKPIAAGDDEALIDGMITELQVCQFFSITCSFRLISFASQGQINKMRPAGRTSLLVLSLPDLSGVIRALDSVSKLYASGKI